jgi:uncharacterized delta-60 repeat protein
MKTKILPLLLCLLFMTNLMYAQDGKLDSTFGKNGFTKVNPEDANPNSSALCHAMAIAKNGNIIIAGVGYNATQGATYSTIVELKPDGSLNKSFGNNGIINYQPFSNPYSPGGISSIVIQGDGKFLVASKNFISNLDNHNLSDNEIIITRFTSTGKIDTSFARRGTMDIHHNSLEVYDAPGPSIALLGNGKIVVAATNKDSSYNHDFVTVWRFNKNGMPDHSFNSTGIIDLDHYFSIWTMTASKLILRGSNIFIGGTAVLNDSNNVGFNVIKLDSTGLPVPPFGIAGFAVKNFGAANTSECYDMVIKSNGDIILAGSNTFDGSYQTGTFVSFNKDGDLNANFNSSGVLTLASPYTIFYGLTLQSDGKIVAAAISNINDPLNANGMLARIKSNGVFDNSFGKKGIVNAGKNNALGYTQVALDGNNNIIAAGASGLNAAGYYVFVAARYFGTASSFTNENNGVFNSATAAKTESASPFIYPNPVQSNCTLNYSLDKSEMVSILLYDVNGRLMQTVSNSILMNAGVHTQSIHFNQNVLPGVYKLIIKTATKELSINIMKQ